MATLNFVSLIKSVLYRGPQVKTCLEKGKNKKTKKRGRKLVTSKKIQTGTYCIYQCLISTSLFFYKIKVRLRKEQGVQFRADEM